MLRGCAGRGRQEKEIEGEGALGVVLRVGRQDKRTATRMRLSGCLHIVFYGTNGLADGAIVGWLARKRLILLVESGWQAGGIVAPNAFKPLNP